MVTQVVHIPILNFISHLFQTTYLCDISKEALEHSWLKVAGAAKPKTTLIYDELCTAPELDLVVIASNHPLHASQAELGLKADKYVFIDRDDVGVSLYSGVARLECHAGVDRHAQKCDWLFALSTGSPFWR